MVPASWSTGDWEWEKWSSKRHVSMVGGVGCVLPWRKTWRVAGKIAIAWEKVWMKSFCYDFMTLSRIVLQLERLQQTWLGRPHNIRCLARCFSHFQISFPTKNGSGNSFQGQPCTKLHLSSLRQLPRRLLFSTTAGSSGPVVMTVIHVALLLANTWNERLGHWATA